MYSTNPKHIQNYRDQTNNQKASIVFKRMCKKCNTPKSFIGGVVINKKFYCKECKKSE